jgi:hypothetical protein
MSAKTVNANLSGLTLRRTGLISRPMKRSFMTVAAAKRRRRRNTARLRFRA